MFDTYQLPSRYDTHVSNNTTITEKRAPTDESIKLLKEMEAAALSKIVNSVRVENTTFNCVVHSYFDGINISNKFMVIFKLNGKQIDLPLEISTLKTREQTAKIIWQKVSERIAAEIAVSFNKAFQNLSFMDSQFT